MSKGTARAPKQPYYGEFEGELDETAPLPLLPDGSALSAEAANDTEFELSDKTAMETLDRLLTLAESIVKRLDHIAETIATPKPTVTRKKKTTASRKKKAASKRKKAYAKT